MIKAIALDDEPLALKIIENFCSKIDYILLEKTFSKPSEAEKFLRKFPVDLIFLDIEMPNKNGLDFYKALNHKTKVIFTTAHRDYAVDAFEVSAIDYLKKPFSFERFRTAVEKVKPYNTSVDYLLIRADYKLHKITLQDITLIEGLDDYVKISLNNNTRIVTRTSMKTLLEKLPADQFVRVHRSYIVPLKKIQSVDHKNVYVNDLTIPIGDTYKENLLNRYDLPQK